MRRPATSARAMDQARQAMAARMFRLPIEARLMVGRALSALGLSQRTPRLPAPGAPAQVPSARVDPPIATSELPSKDPRPDRRPRLKAIPGGRHERAGAVPCPDDGMGSLSYVSQRLMRRNLRLAMKSGVIAVLDIGSSKTVCLVIAIDAAKLAAANADGLHLGGFGAMRVLGAGITRSRGVRLGEIVDMEECERAVRTAVHQAEKESEKIVDQVVVCLSAGRPLSFGALGHAEIASGSVSETDRASALSAATRPPLGDDREVLHAMPVNYLLDGVDTVEDPRGLTGRRLSVDLHVVTALAAPLRNLARCVRHCDLSLAGVVASPYASGVSTLVEDEQELGAACIDLGSETTGISIFLRKQPIYVDAIRVGGRHVTRDIAEAFHIDIPTAERIKVLHGGVIATGLDDRDEFEVTTLEGAVRNITRAALIGVIRPRVEEILEEVADRLHEAGFDGLPTRKVVLTGGCSQLPGIDDAARRQFGNGVRIGRPIRIPGLPRMASETTCSAIAGLAAYAVQPHDEIWDFEIGMDETGGSRMTQAMRWVQRNW